MAHYSDPAHQLLDRLDRTLCRVADALELANQLAVERREREAMASRHVFRAIPGTTSVCTCGLPKNHVSHDVRRKEEHDG